MNYEKITEEFFKRRFKIQNIECKKKTGYFQEWVRRFKSENPEQFMDEFSLEIWKEMKQEYCKKKCKCGNEIKFEEELSIGVCNECQ